MKTFAEIVDGVVIQTIVADEIYIASLEGTYIEYSDKGEFRKNPACIGGTYRSDLDAFIYPKPFSKWVLNESSCRWEAPTQKPNDGQRYDWDDVAGNWVVSPNGK